MTRRSLLNGLMVLTALSASMLLISCGREPGKTGISLVDPKNKQVPDKPLPADQDVLLQAERVLHHLSMAGRQVEKTIPPDTKKDGCVWMTQASRKWHWEKCKTDGLTLTTGTQLLNADQHSLHLNFTVDKAGPNKGQMFSIDVTLKKYVQTAERAGGELSIVVSKGAQQLYKITSPTVIFIFQQTQVIGVDTEDITIESYTAPRTTYTFRMHAPLQFTETSDLLVGEFNKVSADEKAITVTADSSKIKSSEGSAEREWTCKGLCALPTKDVVLSYAYP